MDDNVISLAISYLIGGVIKLRATESSKKFHSKVIMDTFGTLYQSAI